MKALVISTAPPDATSENQTGSTNWTLRLLRLLSHNHDITLLSPPPLTDPFLQKADFRQIECQPDDPSGRCLRFIKSLIWKIYPSMWHQRSSMIDQFLSQSARASFDVCWLLDDYAGMYLRKIPKSLPVVFCRHFVLNMGLVEQSSKQPLDVLRLAWHRWIAKGFDRWTTQRANITITGTKESQQNLQSLARDCQVAYFPTKPTNIPSPVSEEIICSSTRPDKRVRIAYVGDMSFPRNAEGVQWFLSKVLPRLPSDFLLQVHFSFFGRQPSTEVMEVKIPPDASVKFEGFVDDLETKLHQCQAAIVPVFGGNGIRIKTVTLLAAGLPAVSTKDGVEGLPLEPTRDITIADDPKTFAIGLQSLLDENHRRNIAKSCRKAMAGFLSEDNDAATLFSISEGIA